MATIRDALPGFGEVPSTVLRRCAPLTKQSDGNDAVVKALMHAEQERYEEVVKKLCKRLNIEYVADDGDSSQLFMFYLIGRNLVYETKEYNSKKRGRPPAALSEAAELALTADHFKSRAKREGKTISDKEIAHQIVEGFSEVGRDVDPFHVARQISRGRRELREIRERIARKSK